MHKLGIEEKAALLLATDDNDDDNNIEQDRNSHEMIESPSITNNNNPNVIKTRRKISKRTNASNNHPVLCFALMMGAFILGCFSGISILLYRMSQDSSQGHPLANLIENQFHVDLSIRNNLFQSIATKNFFNVNRSFESTEKAASNLYEQWKTFSPTLTNINRISYEIKLSKYKASTKWNGIAILENGSEKELSKFNILNLNEFISFSTLIQSGQIDADSIYFVNYGRQEDFAYLFKNQIRLSNTEKSIVFMKRKSTVISQTEQIRQAIYYGFAALVLFDDDKSQIVTSTNDRHSFYKEFTRHLSADEHQNFLEGNFNKKKRTISVLTLSLVDIQKLFESLQPDSNSWLTCPNEWYTNIKIVGGTLSTFKIRLTVDVEDIEVKLPVVMSSIRGAIDPNHFIMVGLQLNSLQQNKIINELIQSYSNQIKSGWNPKRSIIFSAWSGLEYDHYTIRRWLSDNFYFVNKNLIAYLDIENGIIANSTLNLHGSPLLEHIAYQSADLVPSPLKHNHTCHHRAMSTVNTQNQQSSHDHDHGRRKRDEGHEHHMESNEKHEQEEACEPHKLLDEWMRASRNQFGGNKTFPIVQPIDTDSSASLFQLQYGIPSISIQMTEEKTLKNNSFYFHHSISNFDENIQPEVYVAYTQYLSEFIRQLIDESFILLNLTNYANEIDKYVTEFVANNIQNYISLSSHLGDIDEFKKIFNSLTRTIREIDFRIKQIPENDYIQRQLINTNLIEFERLLIMKDRLFGMNSDEKNYNHIFIGPAFGLTNVAVPFPSLSNVLFQIPGDPQTELCEFSQNLLFRLKEHVHFINRTLNGINGLFSVD